jgi:general secretion pathway protein G
MKSKQTTNSAFTLLEIMLVVTIIALLMGAAIYKMTGTTEYAKHVKISADIQGIGTQLKLYESMNGFYPTTEQGLEALVTQPSTDPQPSRWYQLFKEQPKDPWQNNYIYRCPGIKNPSGYDLYSAGPDRVPDTADDDWGQ